MKRRFPFLIMDASCLSSNELEMQLKYNSGEFLLGLCQKHSIAYREKVFSNKTVIQHDDRFANRVSC